MLKILLTRSSFSCCRQGRFQRWFLFTLAGLMAQIVCGPMQTAAAAKPNDKEYYVERSTWQETMRASREKLQQIEQAGIRPKGSPPFVSEIVRGGERARHVSFSVAGKKELFLFVTGIPNIAWGAATWADPKLIAKDGSETRVCHIKGLRILRGRHDIDRNLESGVSGPLHIAGRHFEHGIHVCPESAVRVPLDREYERFDAWIGMDDWVGKHGHVRFTAGGSGAGARQELWTRLAMDFSEATPRRQMKWEFEDRILEQDWSRGDDAELARRYAAACFRVPALVAKATDLAANVRDAEGLDQVRNLYYDSRAIDEMLALARKLNFKALRLAIQDLRDSFPDRFANGMAYQNRLDHLETALAAALRESQTGNVTDIERVVEFVRAFDRLKSEALLANPLLDFDRLLLVKRVPDGDPRRPNGRGYSVGEYLGLPRQSSKCNPNIERPIGWDNEIAVLSPVRPEGKLTTLFKPSGGELVLDLDLHCDADKLAFSMPAENGHWRVWEIDRNGRKARQFPVDAELDVDYFDPCYLPSDDIAFISTAVFQGVPCNAGVIVGMMYRMDAEGKEVRQICFEQDHDYHPSVMNDGRILYLRWDYTDTPHVWNRMLFATNPDGTGQAEVYGNNSYWPNGIFYARSIPNHPTKLVGIVTGHHVGRVGELTIFDPAKGKKETAGVVQRIPGYGKTVEPIIQDKLTEHSWPKFLHPYPLSDKYFIVSCKPTPDSLWGIYLVDVFDNMVLLKESERHALLEPIPFRKTLRPPVIPDRPNWGVPDALVHLINVHSGPGMKGIPDGTVKKLRVFTYHFAYQKQAGITDRVGSDGPWEVKRVLGTVPVYEDGSAFFRIPAKTPISVQPLDEKGRAVALMRSWMTAMPGETLTCVGCHEQEKSSAPINNMTLAMQKPPVEIETWHGPPRGFSFQREVQPVLDKYCVGCHDGRPRKNGRSIPDLRGHQNVVLAYQHGNPEPRVFRDTSQRELLGKYRGLFEPSYLTLRGFVRVGGLESDLHLLNPMEFSSTTSELIQMLDKGHHNVQLDQEAWDRLTTWIDLNAPCHGTWSEFSPIKGGQRERRVTLRAKYGGVVEDWEEAPNGMVERVEPIRPERKPRVKAKPIQCANWPFDATLAQQRQTAGGPATQSVDLGNGVTIAFVRIPAGRFVMGDPDGYDDERPQTVVQIAKPFWMAKCELTNAQYTQFDPSHDSRFEHRSSWIFSKDYLGWPVNEPEQPVVRVSWNEAMAFCRWLSNKIGVPITLPTEAQWEYACRAGTATPFSHGDVDTDFSKHANLADYTMRELAYGAWRPKPLDLVPRDARFNDGALVTAAVGSYQPNAWRLCDMHGNAAEWTRTTDQPYPYQDNDGRNTITNTGKKVVRGGSWHDRPKRCRSAARISYPAYQKVYDVGFRVVCETALPSTTVAAIKTRP